MVNDLWETVVAYFRQETVDPLKNLGTYVALGVAGGLLIGLGLVFLALGGLRALQTELGGKGGATLPQHGHLSGNWTWAPYAAAALFCAIVAVLFATRINKTPSNQQR
jgi:hypothetical protein